jgi:hypothetical protein
MKQGVGYSSYFRTSICTIGDADVLVAIDLAEDAVAGVDICRCMEKRRRLG